MQHDDFEVSERPGLDSIGVSDQDHPLRVAIVTEEILGPVRNGGIASTYYHLAKGLAAHGHEVHVLFLKGPVVQDETPEAWVERYAEFGVVLHYLDQPVTPLLGPSPAWQQRYVAAYHWLRDQEPFDVVHTSEWRGGLVYALMAKRLGLAFRETLFVVKTSSPYIWNRHYQMQPITSTDLMAAAYAEQKCVELADIVVGGSAHLISFMEHIGYRLPEANVHVQPNIVDFSHVPVVDGREGPRREPGDVVESRDLVFFGRLEARKGIEIFCGAIDLLHEWGCVPDSVTFLGKWNGRLPGQGGVTPEEFVDEKASTWSCRVAKVTDRNQPAALSFLCSKDQVAVMPSLIENSSMAVYELLEQRVPFIATDVGGTPELVDQQDHDACLVAPTAEALATRLADALRSGQVIPRARFSNAENLEIWYGFHAYVGKMIAEHGRARAVAALTERIDQRGPRVDTIGHLVLVRRGDSLDALVKALRVDPPDHVVLGYKGSNARAEIERVSGPLAELPSCVTVTNCLGKTAGEALNQLMAESTCDAVVVSDGATAVPQEGYVRAVREALTSRPGCLFTTFFATTDTTVGMPMGGDIASQIATSRAYGPETIALRRETWEEVGDFEPYEARHGLVHEYVTRAARAGHDLLVFPEPLLSWPEAADEARALADDSLYSYLKAKAVIDGCGIAQRKILLSALSGIRGASGDVEERLLREPGVEPAQSHWLMPATWDSYTAESVHNRRLLIGLDHERDQLWFYARGRGDRRLLMRGEEQQLDLLIERGDPGTDDYVTLSTASVATWERPGSYPLLWGLYEDGEKLRNLFLRLNRIGHATFALACRQPVLSSTALSEVVEWRPLDWVEPREGAAQDAPDEVEAPGPPDRTEEYINDAVATAREVISRRHDRDPVRAMMESRALLERLPRTETPVPVMPRSGLKPPRSRDGWVAGDWLRGWAWDREDRDRMLHVALTAGDDVLLVAVADEVDRSLDEVPGRDLHGFSLLVRPEFLQHDRLDLVVWEGWEPVFRGQLYVDRGRARGRTMLRRARPSPAEAQGAEGRRRWQWWRRR